MTRPIVGRHLVRYGTAADQKFLVGALRPTYDGLVVNATMAAHIPTALASFISQMVKKPFFIDPQTHAFQHDVENLESTSSKKAGKIKRSIQALLDAYGEPIATTVGQKRRPVLPSHFASAKVRKGFCERVMRFQLEHLAKRFKSSDAAKYFQFLQAKGKLKTAQCRPGFVIAPYFYMTANTLEKWLRVNLSMLKECQSSGGASVGAQVVISRDVLSSPSLCSTLASKYKSARPDVILVWIDAFPEESASRDELLAFASLLKEFGRTAPTVNLHGGYLSVVLSRSGLVQGLDGVAHGLEYGESRGVVPVGGGIPTAKYYYPEMHVRLLFRDAMHAVRAAGGLKSARAFHRDVCDCVECKKVVKSSPEDDFAAYGKTRPVSFIRRGQPVAMDYPVPETKDHSVRHYMWCKKVEYATAQSVPDVINGLRLAERFKKELGASKVAHCRIWSSVLRALSKS